MKLLQLNIWGGRIENKLLEQLSSFDADIICLQEAVSLDGTAMFNTTTEEISKELNLNHTYFSPVYSFTYSGRVGSFGNAILSKAPHTSQHTLFTRLDHKVNFNFDTDDYNVRNLQHCTIEVGNKTVHILNHHGHHVHQHKNGDPETLRQCELINNYASTLVGPIILSGDFNLAPDSESINIFDTRFINLSKKHELTTTRTILTDKTEVCDYIFVSKDVQVNSFYASDELMSDHVALVLDFTV